MLRASRLEQAARAALLAWVEDGVVVGIQRHLCSKVRRSHVAGVCRGCEVEEDIGEDDGDSSTDLMRERYPRPGMREEEVF